MANCGVFISFQNHLQKELMKELLNFEDEDKSYLSMLRAGQCIIRVNSIGKPFLLQIPLIERNWLTLEEINENIKKVFRSIKKMKKGLEFDDRTENLILNAEIKEGKENLQEKNRCQKCGNYIVEGKIYCKECNSFIQLEKFIKILTIKQSKKLEIGREKKDSKPSKIKDIHRKLN